MKKILASLLTLLILTACTNANTKITSNEVLMEIDGKKFHEQDLYQAMKSADQGSTVLEFVEKTIGSEVELSDEDIQKTMEELDQFGDYLDDFLKEQNFENKEEFLEEGVYPRLKFEKIIKEDIEKHFDDLSEQYPAKLYRAIQVDENDADEAIQRLKDGEDMESIAENLAEMLTQFKGQEAVYIPEQTQLPTAISQYLDSHEGPGLSDPIDSGGSSKYIIQIIQVDVGRFKEQAIESYADIEEVYSTSLSNVMKEHKFKIHDIDVYTGISNQYPQYLGE